MDRVTGEVSVAKPLLRDVAAVVRLTVLVTDITATTSQQGSGKIWFQFYMTEFFLHYYQKLA